MIFAGAGFAAMAWELAQRRMGRPGSTPLTREQARHVPSTWASSEYYRLIDKASDGFAFAMGRLSYGFTGWTVYL